MSNKSLKSYLPIQALVPCIITLTALCLGLIAIRYSLDAKFKIAAALIVISAILDSLDGRIARFLNSTTSFGAQLDSLADLINFGLSPALLIYMWSLQEISYRGVGWAILLFYVCCSAIRLARFNVGLEDDNEEKDENYFIGLPMPAAAGLSLLPVMLSFELVTVHTNTYIIAAYITFIGLLMISRIPVFSGKTLTIKKKFAAIITIALGLVFGFAILEPWIVLPIMGIFYILFLPFGILLFYRKKRGMNA